MGSLRSGPVQLQSVQHDVALILQHMGSNLRVLLFHYALIKALDPLKDVKLLICGHFKVVGGVTPALSVTLLNFLTALSLVQEIPTGGLCLCLHLTHAILFLVS